MLKLFIDMTRPIIQKLEEAQKNSDRSALRELAHSLKGGARSACLNELGDKAAALQDAVEKGGDVSLFPAQISEAFKRAEQEISLL